MLLASSPRMVHGRVQPAPGPLSLQNIYDIWIVLLLTAGLDGMIGFMPNHTNAVRLGLGLAVGLFVPGYLSTLALFPEPDTLDSIERTGLSLVLSVVWIPLLALLLSLTHIRLNAAHMVLAISLVALVTAALGIWRRSLSATATVPSVYPNGRARWYLATLVLVLGVLTWLIVAPNLKAQSLAFSVLGAGGQLQGYPYQVTEGQRYRLLLSIDNPSSQRRTFIVETVANGTPTTFLTASVAAGHTWSHPILLPSNAPARQEAVRFVLLTPKERTHLRTLWVRYRIVS